MIWDTDRGRWFMVNAEGQKLGFYTSADLRSWRRVGEFVRTDLGVLECPDIFRMTADDGSSHWILRTSANGRKPHRTESPQPSIKREERPTSPAAV
ncbi:hypothetical protein [Arthrobacter globiformis]|uniref:hypothetical protein n=1 Tax=Arthrobacter globiformis TaxID=1665 RepID=UPI0027812B73|nr:hypothetical protein [Arthrobacter globiformis]MDQ0865017.1 sucrose-6-phosphate hydrolase SacC (GH32 family) [Arthrobacter globiformis]